MACVVSSSLVVSRRLSSFVVVCRRRRVSNFAAIRGKLLQVTLHGCVIC